ncbi:MAG TPA: hypothetical protein VMZ74_07665 [Ramlibacter sp.]|nr:hypothetical protein [Ramlibacter sp.]
MRYLLIAAVCATTSAFAQVTPAVMTDTNYAPAEDRSSVGAVLLESQMVIAQRRAFGTRSTPDEVQAIGRGVMQATLAAAQAQDMGPDTRALGGPPAPVKKSRRGTKPELQTP